MDKPDAAVASPASAAAMAGQPRADESSYEYYRRTYRDTPYYSSGRTWADYAPAYRYAMEATAKGPPDATFEPIESRLEAGWEAARDGSRLSWPEARGAVRHVFADTQVRRANTRRFS